MNFQEIVIETKNLTKYFGDFIAVNNLNLKVFKGEIYGLLGPNGAGKTTTIKILVGLLKQTSGEAYILGEKIP
ncbi:MAG: ATP-binding cassette domain-containing protein, partial [Thermoplasmata archaeon]